MKIFCQHASDWLELGRGQLETISNAYTVLGHLSMFIHMFIHLILTIFSWAGISILHI